MSGPSSKALFVPSGTRTGVDLRIIAKFWMAFSGSARTSAPWRGLPEEFGKWSSVYRQFRRWTLAGLWEDILDVLNPAEVAPDRRQMVDSTVIRAHHHAAGAKGGLRKRLLAVREVGSRPRSIVLRQRCRPPDEDRDHAWAGFRLHRV